MNSPKNPSDDAGKPRLHRPSLGGSSAAPTASILQTLEGTKTGASAAPARRSKLPLLAGLSLAAALAAWLVLRPTPVASPDLRVAEAKAPAQPAAVPQPAVAAAPAASAAAADPATPAPAQAVARLEQLPDTAAPASAAPTSPAAATAAATAAAVAVAAPSTSKPVSRPQASASNRSALPRRVEPRRTASAAKAVSPKPATTASAATTPSADRDVELLAALMSHVGALPRSEQATIAGLVANCRTKPRAEADQCRREICDGYWGKAEACPARGKPAARPAAKTVGKAAPPSALPAQRLAAEPAAR